MRVKPVIPGACIPDPETRRPLPDDGDDVSDTSFWVRRFLAGEVWQRRAADAELAADGTEVSCVIAGEVWVRRLAPGETPPKEAAPTTSTTPAAPSSSSATSAQEAK